ncbi:TVP38/TMEM64 family protein [Deinococcus multiflagellatus]|uniref:TVP38/TMEM64 family protein n=1 Tax=Deinococcus multiflagellatus TaxID=1656887 RepID=UPI001CC9122C|nr:TVP38/TMEM64 family protein [Deinococcus multiflagellatus]MBZ9714603.1 TVP38/TMEM64 family protein [Deinococcus multiflagellatus]
MTAAAHPPRYLRWLILGGAALLLIVVALQPEVRAFLGRGYAALTSSDPQVTHAFVSGLGWAGPLALIAGFVLQAVLPVLPALVMTAVTARAYGPLEGFVIVYVGTLLGAAAGYGLGRLVGDTLVRTLAGERARLAAHAFAERHGVQGVLMVRLMPVLSADVMNLVAGAARMGFRPFMLATAAGALPVTALVVWLSGSGQRLMWGLGLLSAVVGAVALGRWWLSRRAGAGRRDEGPVSEEGTGAESTPGNAG